MSRKIITKNGAISVLLLVIILAAVFIFKNYNNKKRTQLRLSVTVSGREEINVPLKANTLEKDYVLSNNMVITVKGNNVWIKKSDCKNRICVHSGVLSKSGDTAVCVPNKTVISIKGVSYLTDAKTG